MTGCSISVDGSGARFRCEEGDPCPPGLVCSSSGYCEQSPGIAYDGGSSAIDAQRSAYASAVLADQPLLYYRLGDSDLLALDWSANGRDGTYAATVDRDAMGALAEDDGAAAFDAIGDVVRVDIDDELLIEGDFSVEFWARRLEGDTSQFPGILRYGESEDTGFLIYWESSFREMTFKRAGIDLLYTIGEPIDDTFKHYAVTYDESTGTLSWYVNGAFNQNYSGLLFPASAEAALTFEIGRGDTAGQHVIDELAMYDRVLSIERVAAHYQAAN